MSTVKALLCDLCVILVFGFVFADDIMVSPFDGTKGNCTCGGFASASAAPGADPLISRSPGLEVKCDDDGDSTCKQLCIALATAAKAKGPEMLCSRLKDADELKLSAYYKICERPWIYADMTAEEPLCCENTKPKVCPSAEKTNATEVEAKTAM